MQWGIERRTGCASNKLQKWRSGRTGSAVCADKRRGSNTGGAVCALQRYSGFPAENPLLHWARLRMPAPSTAAGALGGGAGAVADRAGALRGLLCLDLDGTLLGSNHAVSRANADAVAAAAAAGWAVALSTGRGPSMYCPTPRELGLVGGVHLVGYNGAVVYELDLDGRPTRALHETKMTNAQVRKILDLADGLAVELDVCDIQHARRFPGEPAELLRRHTELVRSAPVITAGELPDPRVQPNKMTVLTADPAGFVAAAAAVPGFADDGIGVVVGGPFWVETVTLAFDKAAGVALVCKELGIGMDRCVYLGDGANDATSLSAVGLGVAMRGSKQEAVAAADRVSRWTNDEDAVAKEISLLLGAEGVR